MEEPKRLLKSGGQNLFNPECGSNDGNDSNEVKTPNTSRSAVNVYKDKVEDAGKNFELKKF